MRASVAPDGKGAKISYDLQQTAGATAIVSLYYSLDNGATYNSINDPLSGDIGDGVSAGQNKSITWPRMGVSLHAFHGDQVKFRVAALPGSTNYAVQFDSEMSSATEGQGTAHIKLSAQNQYFGKIRYKIAAMTDVTTGSASGDVAPLTGEVQMNAGTAVIDVNIHDDFVIEKPKALTLDIAYDSTLGYDVGPTFRHMLVLHDNDGYWNGALMGNKLSDGEASFRMAILQNGSVYQGKLISANTTGSLSTFPTGEWPLNVGFNGTVFTASTQAAGLPVPATGMFPGATGMSRHVTFAADTSTTGIYKPNVILAGRFTDTLQGSGAASYLGGTTEGGFALIREHQAFIPPDPPVLPLADFAAPAPSHADGVLNLSKGTNR